MINQDNYPYNNELREKARAIVSFKIHRSIFLLSNVLIWILSITIFYTFEINWHWAIFPTSVWIIILTFHHLFVFKWNNKSLINKEYEKLLKYKEKNNKENN